MKIHILKYRLLGMATLLLAYACNEDLSYREPSGTSKGVPQQVTEVQVKNYPGKATISYNLPADPDLLYVKATYTLANGKVMDVKSSYFVDSLVVEGFADTQEHEIKLYTVNRQEVHSEPIAVTVKPLKAPIWSVLETIDIRDAFGGYKLTALNRTQEAIGILIMEQNILKEWEVNNNLSVYTSVDSILSQRSGMDTITRHFGIAIRDRWSNITDTLYKDINPIYEVELNTANFRHFPLPGDPAQQPGAAVANMWDKRYGWPVSFTSLAAATLNVPSIVTIDMGVSAKLSKVWIRPFKELSNLYYGFTTLRHFELWGSTNPNLSGALDESWTLLGKYELKKPSGSPGNTETASDQEAAANGFFYDIDLDAPKIRYLRIRCMVNWAGSCPQSVDELKVFGDPR